MSAAETLQSILRLAERGMAAAACRRAGKDSFDQGLGTAGVMRSRHDPILGLPLSSLQLGLENGA